MSTPLREVSLTNSVAAPARPAWFKARPSTPAATEGSRAPVQPARPGLAALLVTDDSPQLWRKFVLAVSMAHFGWGLAVSSAVHVTVLAALAFIVFHQPRAKTDIVYGTFGIPGDETILDSRLTLEVGGASNSPEFTNLSDAVNSTDAFNVAGERIQGALMGSGRGGGTGEGEGDGDGLGAMGGKLRIPSFAVTKGSFSVWTDPKDPIPGERYYIIINVKLPRDVRSYRLRDLEGDVHGTDNYVKKIKYDSSERRPVKDGNVQLSIFIPGANALVKDVIRIKSELLKEEQTIEIVF